MIYNRDPKQTVLFPELLSDLDLPSITTLPDYDKALENFIKMSDFGAFIELNIAGLEKSFSLSFDELHVPRRYRQRRQDANSPIFYLFPTDVRNHLNRLKYEARAFFNKTNSVKTGFGYFVFRQYFHLWDLHRQKFTSNLFDYLRLEIGEKRYQRYFLSAWNDAVKWTRLGIKRKFHHLLPPADIELIQNRQQRFRAVNLTISQLDREDQDHLLNCLILKTLHIPPNLPDYIDGISVLSTFKTIHLEHLKNISIESLEDLLEFLNTLPKQS